MHWAAITAIAVGGYVVLAALIVRIFPLRGAEARRALQRRKVPYPVKRVAHRGGSLLGPENTMHTFERAVNEGLVDVLELDVIESKDGVAIVCHDETLERLCGVPTRVAELVVGGRDETQRDKLPLLRSSISLHFPSLTRDSYVGEGERQRLCTLREVFERLPTTPIHLDMKAPSATLVPTVIELIEEFDRMHLTILGAGGKFNEEIMYEELKKPCRAPRAAGAASSAGLLPHRTRRECIATFGSFREILKLYALYYTGLLPFVPLRIDVMSIPMPTEAKRIMFTRFLRSAWKARLLGFLLRTPAMWHHVQRRGVTVLGWVLNDESEFEEVQRFGIDGIMTDDPVLLQRFYDSKAAASRCS